MAQKNKSLTFKLNPKQSSVIVKIFSTSHDLVAALDTLGAYLRRPGRRTQKKPPCPINTLCKVAMHRKFTQGRNGRKIIQGHIFSGPGLMRTFPRLLEFPTNGIAIRFYRPGIFPHTIATIEEEYDLYDVASDGVVRRCILSNIEPILHIQEEEEEEQVINEFHIAATAEEEESFPYLEAPPFTAFQADLSAEPLSYQVMNEYLGFMHGLNKKFLVFKVDCLQGLSFLNWRERVLSVYISIADLFTKPILLPVYLPTQSCWGLVIFIVENITLHCLYCNSVSQKLPEEMKTPILEFTQRLLPIFSSVQIHNIPVPQAATFEDEGFLILHLIDLFCWNFRSKKAIFEFIFKTSECNLIGWFETSKLIASKRYQVLEILASEKTLTIGTS